MIPLSATNPRAFAVWFEELERWSVSSFIELDWNWPEGVIKPLATALQRKQIPVASTTKSEDLLLVTLHFDGEMEPRGQRGTQTIKGRLWWADPGDVVYSRIDVRNGAIGVVPQALGRICLTSEYPVYSVDQSVADAQYIKLVFRTQTFRRKINGMISGASGRKRVQPENLETIEVPLPTLSIQRAIVAAWEQEQAEIAGMRRKIIELEEQIEDGFLASLGLTKREHAIRRKAFALEWKDFQSRWGVAVNQQALSQLNLEAGKYPIVSLGDVIADLENGWSPLCLNRPAESGEWGILKMGAVSFGVFNEQQNKAILTGKVQPQPKLEVKPGDWLISRANITRLVGACALIRQTRPNLMLCDKIFRAVWRDPSPVDPEYLDEVMKIPHLREQIESNVTGTSATMKNITKPSLLALRLPLPPLDIQRELVTNPAMKRREIAELKTSVLHNTERARAQAEALVRGDKAVI